MSQKRSLLSAYFILFMDNFGFAVIFPIFPILFLDKEFGLLPVTMGVGMRNFLLGIVLCSFSLAQFFGAPFFGDVADKIGRKKTLFATTLGTLIGYLITALALVWKSYSLLLVSRIFTGFLAGNLALCMAIVADLSPEEKVRSKRMSYVSFFLGISWVLAIIIGGFFTNPEQKLFFDPRIPLFVTAFLTLLSLFVLVFFYKETAPLVEGAKIHLFKAVSHILNLFKFKNLRVLYGVLFFWFFGFAISLQWIVPISLQKFHVSQTSVIWLMSLFGLGWALASALVNPWLVKHFSL